MFHANRRHHITRIPPTPESIGKLAQKLKDQSQTHCTGFRIGDILLLNDSITEDNIKRYQEFAVYWIKDTKRYQAKTFWGIQIESLTVNSPRPAGELAAYIQALADDPQGKAIWPGSPEVRPIDITPDHSCILCA